MSFNAIKSILDNTASISIFFKHTIYIYIYIYTHLTGLNSVFFLVDCYTKVKEPSWSYYLSIAGSQSAWGVEYTDCISEKE